MGRYYGRAWDDDDDFAPADPSTFDELSLSRSERLPPSLQRALRLASRCPCEDLLDELANQLNLPTDRASLASWRLLDALVVPLAGALDQGRRFLDERPAQIARTAAEHLDLSETVDALIEFGWGTTRLGSVTAAELRRTATDKLAANLSNHVQRMMLRWERQGRIADPPNTAA